jgi:hypothetical protein
MSKPGRDYAGDLHAQHDRELADRVGNIDSAANLNSKIPLRIKTDVVSSHERRETLIPNTTKGKKK